MTTQELSVDEDVKVRAFGLHRRARLPWSDVEGMHFGFRLLGIFALVIAAIAITVGVIIWLAVKSK